MPVVTSSYENQHSPCRCRRCVSVNAALSKAVEPPVLLDLVQQRDALQIELDMLVDPLRVHQRQNAIRDELEELGALIMRVEK